MSVWVWGISDLLRGVYKPHEYGRVILPFTILRRMDCVMEPPTGADRRAAKQNYGNTSGLSLPEIVEQGSDIHTNLLKFIDGFEGDAKDIFDRFGIAAQIDKLDSEGLLAPVVQRFATLDLHPEAVSNTDMGMLFEDLIRRSHHDSPGEDFTPRDAVALLVDLLIAERRTHIAATNVSQRIYDPTAGTGGLLTVASDRFRDLNPHASLRLFGQEINDQSYAVCKADVLSKGKTFGDIKLGNTLIDDQFSTYSGTKGFHYVVSNPPYGVDWKSHAAEVKAEHAKGDRGRFPAGLPRVSDGAMLFLQHVVSKMKTPKKRLDDGAFDWLDGGRGAIVLSASPLFNGGAGSGESEIRRYLLANDLVEAIVALPAGLFTNTGIGTYIWLLDNTKRPDRRGKVQLIDAREIYTKMRKNVGDKNREMSEADRRRILDAYEAFEDADPDVSKIFANDAFGYWLITHARPVPMRYVVDEDAVARVVISAPEASDVVADLIGQEFETAQALFAALGAAATARGGAVKTAHARNAVRAIGQPVDEHENVTYKGTSLTPNHLTETETVSFGYAGPDVEPDYDRAEAECIAAYMDTEVKPYYPDAAVDEKKTKIGYEIPFTRHFYRYVPPRPLDEIDADLNRQAALVMEMLRKVEAS
ncbi:class I SAM-dependent DNA methyltransferase [Nocardioides sp. zg-DK7169]|uniref:type I restriction-modification system subunit M n=1 Tax=Nocardioides sp. zg-DK7169 TaxID=2736600 RepID=UPI001555FF45|nr:class I SAM-dependent DNA methyltransferase [Nocardioides sp. zg-DK7169]NPC98741.1 SAM-dependent DNA methyltransferase [Nocardioides sp. zg-DK7169]